MPDLSVLEALVRLALAGALGGAVGLERELRDHDAGFRTNILVAVGACLFTVVSAYGFDAWAEAGGVVRFDPSRVSAQIVAGIGFLGAGAIIVRGASVRGLTTAAAVWVVAAIGVAVGIGLYAEAAGATALVLVSLRVLRSWTDRALRNVTDDQGTLVVGLDPDRAGRVLREVERVAGSPRRIELTRHRAVIDVTIDDDVPGVLQAIAALDGVEHVEWSS